MNRQTVTINGRVYDVRTGQPVHNTTQTPAQTRPVNGSHAIHHATQKSQTLNRQIVQKTTPKSQPSAQKTSTPAQKSSSISKFASQPTTTPKTSTPRKMDVAPTTHPIAAKAQQKQAIAKQQQVVMTPQPSHVIKQQAIDQAMQQTPDRHTANKQQPKKKRPKFLSLASAGLALLLLGGYFTYLNMPSLSVRVAAAQAGVDATYPSYNPDGYSLNGPVAFSEGQVSLKFAANAGDHDFTINQSKSSWDSSAVFENYVKEKAGENYITYSERGLTIYTYGGNAAWVTDGILYTIEGDAPLSGDQIRRIATSL